MGTELREYLAIDATSKTGLRWIKRPVRNGGVPVGAEAFTAVGSHGYHCGSFMGQQLLAHRVVYFLTHGEWVQEVDHLDGCRTNNHPENLRAVSRSENNHNRVVSGTYRNGMKWCSRIKLNNVDHYLGSFDTKKQARDAYETAKRSLHVTAPDRCYGG